MYELLKPYDGFKEHNVTESQNHRVIEFGSDLQRSSSLTPLLKQGCQHLSEIELVML